MPLIYPVWETKIGHMGFFLPEHKGLLKQGSVLAESIVSKEMKWSGGHLYDVRTLADSDRTEVREGVFAQLLRFEPEDVKRLPLYRICLQDTEIIDFIRRYRDIDLVSLFTFIMTHELLHIHRFTTGRADFYETEKEDEEAFVDSLTRLFLAKNPLTGLKNVLTLLDKVEAAPLYNHSKIAEQGRCFNAYL